MGSYRQLVVAFDCFWWLSAAEGWDEILVKRRTIEKLNLQLDLLFKADICKESFTLLEFFQFDMKSTMRSKLKTCLSSELLDSNVVSLPVGSWSQVFIPQRSIIAVDQFELTLQRKSRGKSDFGEEFLILTLQVALLCFLLAWHSRDPLLKHFTYFNVSGCVCLCVCVCWIWKI